MAAATIAILKHSVTVKAGGRRFRVPNITVTGQYQSGGLALQASDLGLGTIDTANFGPCVEQTGSDGLLIAYWNPSTNKLQLYLATSGAEVANNTDITGTVIRGWVAGF